MFHFFHKWEVVDSIPMVASYLGCFDEDVIVILERCKKCSKERAYYESMNGIKHNLSLYFAKDKIKKYKEKHNAKINTP